MSLSCTICTDSICATDDVNFTQCGHLFHFVCLLKWFDCSRTCPQCRNKVSETSLRKAFLNFNANDSMRDAVSVQQQNDNLHLMVREKDVLIRKQEKDIQKLDDNVKELQKSKKRSESTIRKLIEKDETNKILIQEYTNRITEMSGLTNELVDLKRKLKETSNRLALLECGNIVNKSTLSEVDEMLKTETSLKALGVMVLSLKRALRNSESARSTLKNKLSEKNIDYIQLDTKFKDLDKDFKEMESKNYSLEQKLLDRKPKETIHKIDSLLTNSNDCVIVDSLTRKVNRNDTVIISDSECENSPHRIKSSNIIGLSPLAAIRKVGHKTVQQSISNEFTIFKKQRVDYSNSNDNLNGLGGSQRKENLLRPMIFKPSTVDRLKSGKLTKNPIIFKKS